MTEPGEPLLSVVMPCLNAAGTIERALDSIQRERSPEVEIVVADGGSTDGTVELLRRRAGVDVVSEPDSGLSDAYNRGAGRARGRFLGWLNADDAYLPGALPAVLAALRAHREATWLTGRCVIVDGEGREIRAGVTRYKDFLLRRYSHRLHLTHNFVSAPATFFRRTAFLDLGMMDTSLRYSMDYDLFLRLGRVSRPIILSERLAAFTMTPGTLSMTNFEAQFVEHAQVARRYRADAPAAVVANRALSRAIVLAYRLIRERDRRRLVRS